MLPTGYRTFHFVSFLYVFSLLFFFFCFVSFLTILFSFFYVSFFFVSFRYFSPCFLFVFFLFVSFRFFPFLSLQVPYFYQNVYSFQDHFIREITLIELSYSYYCFNGFVIFLINTFMHCTIFHIQFGKYCCSISLQGSFHFIIEMFTNCINIIGINI